MKITEPRREIYTVTVTVALSQRTVTQGGFIDEFPDATNIEYNDTDAHSPNQARITVHVAAQSDSVAQHRAQALIEAKANAGGYAGGYQLRDVIIEAKTTPARPASTP